MKRVLLPTAVIVALLGIWELLAQTGALADLLGIRESVSDVIVPAPSDVATSLWEDRELLADNGWVTFKEVVLGLAIAVVVGVGFAVALHLNDTLRRAFYPLIVASQTIPIVAIAPVLVLWLGYGIGPEACSRRADLLLPDHRVDPRRPARGRSCRDPDDAHAPREPRR